MIATTQQLIKEAKFGWVGNNINDLNFTDEVSENLEVWYPNKLISSENAIKKMEKDGYRPANANELITYAIKNTNNKEYIIALGSVCECYGDSYVLVLRYGGSKRELSFCPWDGDWDSYYRFLRVRNSAVSNLDTQKSEISPLDTLTLEQMIVNVINAGYTVSKNI